MLSRQSVNRVASAEALANPTQPLISVSCICCICCGSRVGMGAGWSVLPFIIVLHVIIQHHTITKPKNYNTTHTPSQQPTTHTLPTPRPPPHPLSWK